MLKSIFLKLMLTITFYLQKYHCVFVNIDFHITDVKLMALKVFLVVVRKQILLLVCLCLYLLLVSLSYV